MNLYFEFEERRRKAHVTWPKKDNSIMVHLNDSELESDFPTDLLFAIKGKNKVSFIAEDPQDKRLLELQETIKRRLQELVKEY